MNTQSEQPASMVDYIFETYDLMLQDLYCKLFDQILAFADKTPSEAFINDFIGHMSNGLNIASFAAILESLLKYCDLKTMAGNFPDESIAIQNTIKEILRIRKSIDFINRSMDAIEAIVTTIICYN